MKKQFSLLAILAIVLLSVATLQAQRVTPDPCPEECPCVGGFTQIQLYYFGDDNVKVDVFNNSNFTGLIATFNGVNSGQLLTLNSTGLPSGTFNQYVYLVTTKDDGTSCYVRMYARCPVNSWPGALDDLKILGKTFGDFTVYAHTDQGGSTMCSLENIDQDWRVGGNVIAPGKNTLGTRNNESMVLITNDVPRGILTNTGNLGIGTTSPTARLDVAGNARIGLELNVQGQTFVHSNTASTNATTGALIVTGGTGIGQNLNIGQNLVAGGNGTFVGNANVGLNLNVNGTGTIGADLNVGNNAVVGNNLGVATNATVGQNLSVGNDANVGHDLTVSTNATVGQQLTVGTDATVGRDLNVGRDASVVRHLSAGQDVSAGRDASVGRHLAVAQNATVSGRLRVGTAAIPAGYTMSVDGRVICEEVRVRNSTNWPDYVFTDAYALRSLGEVEAFIAANKHLPGIPSAATIEAQAGYDLGEIQRLQMEKIEELTLYAIALNKENTELKAQVAQTNLLLADILSKLAQLEQK
jgi:carbonic anhydrase/acetyltransferase-like protein (isoleucine patch superfamily)